MSSIADVIIVGAGVSGLSAAKEFDRLGLSYSLIEGSHRIGGRAYSEEIAPGVWFDLGCSYLHQAETNPLVAIADELNIKIGKDQGDLFDNSKMNFHHNGVPLNATERTTFLAYMEDCLNTVYAAAERGEDVAVTDLIDLHSEFAVPFAHMMSETLDIDEVSSIDFTVFEEGSDIPVLNGYGNLIASWGANVTVSLNTRADRISWSGTTATVDTSKGTLRGRSILITVSTGMLASGQIEFTPGLPDWKLAAVMGLPTATEN